MPLQPADALKTLRPDGALSTFIHSYRRIKAMERIKQAIERARAERAEPMTSAGAQTASKPAQLNTAVRAIPAPSDVVYHSTKTIPADLEHLRAHRVLTGASDEPSAVAYKVLRTKVLQSMRSNGWQTLAITGMRKGNGKTLTTINLGISLSHEVNQTVLLADLDLRQPRMASYLAAGELPGLSDYLLGRVELSEILFHPGFDRLVVLPGHEPLMNSSEALSSPKMTKLVEELKNRYHDRIILFDLPPLFAGDDVIAFAPNVDAILLVLEDGQTTRSDLKRAYELLDPKRIIGTILNKATQEKDGHESVYY